MNDAVLSYHTNPLTCGVAKFNVQLAEKLGVPLLTLDRHQIAYPLVSIKTSEIDDEDRYECWVTVAWYKNYDVFLHDNGGGIARNDVLRRAKHVYAANATIAESLKDVRPDVTTVFCPSTLTGNPTRGTMNVLTFGMAHKQHRSQLEQLKAMLDDLHTGYTVSVSCGIHEGSSWSEAWKETDALFRDVFGSHARILGFLADDALAKELQDCSMVALFYDPALRANNTTYWAAIDAGKPVYTLTDEHSPSATDPHSWDALMQVMGVSVPV